MYLLERRITFKFVVRKSFLDLLPTNKEIYADVPKEEGNVEGQHEHRPPNSVVQIWVLFEEGGEFHRSITRQLYALFQTKLARVLSEKHCLVYISCYISL